jgi:ferrous iron transport protein B
MNSRKWTWFAIAYQCGFAWVIGFIVWQVGRLFAGGMNIVGLVLALVMLALLCWQLFKPYQEAQKLTVK